jgi:hypothetical protein
MVVVIAFCSCLVIHTAPKVQSNGTSLAVNTQPAAPITAPPSTLLDLSVTSPSTTTPPSSIQDRLSALESAIHNMTKTFTDTAQKESAQSLLQGGVTLFREWSASVVRRFAATACQASTTQAGSTEAL